MRILVLRKHRKDCKHIEPYRPWIGGVDGIVYLCRCGAEIRLDTHSIVNLLPPLTYYKSFAIYDDQEAPDA